MYEIPGDYLMTYDPQYIEQHDDSSDFEESCVPIIAPKRGNHSLIKRQKPRNKRKEQKPNHKMSNMFIDCDQYPVKLKIETEEPKDNVHNKQSDDKRTQKGKSMNSGDQILPAISRLSLMRHKVIPCLSNIFKRTNHSTKHMSVIKENKVENMPDSCYKRCSDCEHRQLRKLYKRQSYAVQPVYAIEGNCHKAPIPFGSTNVRDKPFNNHNHIQSITKNSSPPNLSSSSESESQSVQERQRKVKKFRKRLKGEIMKEHLKYQQNQDVKNQQLQYPSKDHKGPYHVFTTPFQSRTNMATDQGGQYFNEAPSSSSSFWEFLFDKVGKKYQTQRVEMPKACQCSSSSNQARCSPETCTKREKPEPSVCKGRKQNAPGNTCACKAAQPKEQLLGSACCRQSRSSSDSTPMSKATSSMSIKKKPPEKQQKIICKCHDKDKNKKPESSKSQKPPSRQESDIKPCQEGHDNITNSIAQKYNGEILCIHNPPCILINGCLNLPPQKDQPQMAFWPVTELKKSAFNGRKNKKKAIREQSCQYHVPYVEVQQCETPEYKKEKKIQSICHHDPPCEVVRGCHKTAYDPHLQNSCVHVPMCNKIPKCTVGKKNEGHSCKHRPKCPDIPLCSRNYIILTAKENIGTQVKPKSSFICRHVPPCLMIPKCLGKKLCETYMPVDSVPDCSHQPLCEMIPACSRKLTKEMVSVSSQYPNACRIV